MPRPTRDAVVNAIKNVGQALKHLADHTPLSDEARAFLAATVAEVQKIGGTLAEGDRPEPAPTEDGEEKLRKAARTDTEA